MSRDRGHGGNGSRGEWPLATLAWFGPDVRLATHALVVILDEGERQLARRTFASEARSGDARLTLAVRREIQAFVREHGARRTVATEGVIGCPHEAAAGGPLEAPCPHCPYWAERRTR